MKWKFVVALNLCCVPFVWAQSVSDSELIARIKLNRGNFQEWDRGPNLPEKAKLLGKDILASPTVRETPILCDRCPKPDPENHPEVKRAASESDLVAIGHVVRNISASTQNEAFVFTDSEFVVDEVLKSNDASPTSRVIGVGDEVTVTAPGGSVKSGSFRITASPSNRVPLQVGHRYLLFLAFLPNSRSYVQTSLFGFDITKPTVLSLRTTLISPASELFSDRSLFLHAMRSSTHLAVDETSK